MYTVKSSILFLTYKRLEPTQRVFEIISKVRPKKLYIASDGPKSANIGEAARIQEVRTWILENINWPCEVHQLFRDHNLGCRKGVGSAIDWFFGHEERGIILEDDCVPSVSFFQYCDELLEKYEAVEEVMAIGGYNPLGVTTGPEQASYFFSHYFECWGWASWRRSWQRYDTNLEDWRSAKVDEYLRNIQNTWAFRSFWRNILKDVLDARIDTWAYRMLFSMWRHQGLCIIPEKNLVTNVGFGTEASHTTDSKDNNANASSYELDHPLRDPLVVENDRAISLRMSVVQFGISTPSVLYRIVVRTIRKNIPFKHYVRKFIFHKRFRNPLF